MKPWPMILLLLLVILNACSGGRGADLTSAQQDHPATALPDLNRLQSAPRTASIIGPAFIALRETDSIALSAGSFQPGGTLDLGGGSLPHCIYALGGFAAGAGPTSARISVAAPGAEYFIGFSDFVAGRWALAGPFTDSAEVEVPIPPGAEGYATPAAFVSNASTYLALVVPAGSVSFTRVELGVAADSAAPLPVPFARYTGLDSPLVLTWNPSPSHQDWDFAGYVVERAPRFFGSFESLTPLPILDEYLLDGEADPALDYRIRVAAVDASGNRSPWLTVNGPSEELADPICILKIPDGPLTAPVDVTFDMSASFDPLGEEILQYTINLGPGWNTVTVNEPTVTLELQPGSYSVGASIITADTMRYGSTLRTLTVLPQWLPDPTVVFEPQTAADQQYSGIRCWRDPLSSRLVISALDSTIPSRMLIRDQGDGEYEYQAWPALNGVSYWEPFVIGNAGYIPLGDAHFTFALASDDGGYPHNLLASGNYGGDNAACVGCFPDNQGRIWLLRNYSDDLTVELAGSGGNFTVLLDGNVSTEDLDAEMDPASGIVHIGLTRYDAMLMQYFVTYIQFDPQQLSFFVEEVAPGLLGRPDVEYDPVSGQPAISGYNSDGFQSFTIREGPDDWSVPVEVDDSNNNFGADMDFGADGAYFYLCTVQPALYKYNGMDFDKLYDVALTADMAGELVLEPIEGSNSFESLTLVSTGELYHATLNADGTEVLHKEFLPLDCWSLNLSAAAGEGQVHLLGRSAIDQKVEHSSSFDALSWSEELSPASSNFIDLTATAEGELYLARNDEFFHELKYWDGANWVNEAQVANHTYSNTPMLSQVPEDKVRWAVFDDDPLPKLHLAYGNQSDGFSVGTQSVAVIPEFGVVGPQTGFPRLFFGELGPARIEQVCLLRLDSAAIDSLFNPPGVQPLEFYAWNRHTAQPMGVCGANGVQTFFSAYGSDGLPRRITVQATGERVVETLGGDWSEDMLAAEPRRSISTAQSHGGAGMMLIADILGTQARLEWFDNGQWEELPLPAQLTPGPAASFSKPELCVGTDGRWHIFYHDYAQDKVLCVSTPPGVVN